MSKNTLLFMLNKDAINKVLFCIRLYMFGTYTVHKSYNIMRGKTRIPRLVQQILPKTLVIAANDLGTCVFSLAFLRYNIGRGGYGH